jgi:hypothetical protein
MEEMGEKSGRDEEMGGDEEEEMGEKSGRDEEMGEKKVVTVSGGCVLSAVDMPLHDDRHTRAAFVKLVGVFCLHLSLHNSDVAEELCDNPEIHRIVQKMLVDENKANKLPGIPGKVIYRMQEVHDRNWMQYASITWVSYLRFVSVGHSRQTNQSVCSLAEASEALLVDPHFVQRHPKTGAQYGPLYTEVEVEGVVDKKTAFRVIVEPVKLVNLEQLRGEAPQKLAQEEILRLAKDVFPKLLRDTRIGPFYSFLLLLKSLVLAGKLVLYVGLLPADERLSLYQFTPSRERSFKVLRLRGNLVPLTLGIVQNNNLKREERASRLGAADAGGAEDKRYRKMLTDAGIYPMMTHAVVRCEPTTDTADRKHLSRSKLFSRGGTVTHHKTRAVASTYFWDIRFDLMTPKAASCFECIFEISQTLYENKEAYATEDLHY